MTTKSAMRTKIREKTLQDDPKIIKALVQDYPIKTVTRKRTQDRAKNWIEAMRAQPHVGIMDALMSEYGLTNEEGVALMCLAEALLRVPDTENIDRLIQDKITPSNWESHLGHSSSFFINASTWGLLISGHVLDKGHTTLGTALKGAIKRLGEPIIRHAIKLAMKRLGENFILGEHIDAAIKKGTQARKAGYTYSYDMLGEAALTEHDAQKYLAAYEAAIKAIAKKAHDPNPHNNPGISIKLSALYPRYETLQKKAALRVLGPILHRLTRLACEANIALNIDAEEAGRLDLSLDLIESVIKDETFSHWDGFGIVIQAYGKRAAPVIVWFHDLAQRLGRRFAVRLVKGAYWDSEIKQAQIKGTKNFPVFAHKSATDISYLANAKNLLQKTDHLYPQFATHNAHTLACVLEIARDLEITPDQFEFQKLHGMGDGLYALLMGKEISKVRIYAPVGVHKDLLAYLVRRLLENGANSSFVNQILDPTLSSDEVASDPFELYDACLRENPHPVRLPNALFQTRKNSQGWDLDDPLDIALYEKSRLEFKQTQWTATPILAQECKAPMRAHPITNPATGAEIGTVMMATPQHVACAFSCAQIWQVPPKIRAEILIKAADLYVQNAGEIFALLAREAGKTAQDAVSEIREAIDFLYYYANQIDPDAQPLGTLVAISPWNFPLAIFTGQIAAALASGNAVIAKPAETTSLLAARAIDFLHAAGVPKSALQFLPGVGGEIGDALTGYPDIAGVVFTGSTPTAKRIHRSLAHANPHAPLIAETGGVNVMIVDSTALLEQAVKALIQSAYQSAGQRCSACRVVYVQSEIADDFQKMLIGAMDMLGIGDPWEMDTDIGPLIDAKAQKKVNDYSQNAKAQGRVIHALQVPQKGHFASPVLIAVEGIQDIPEEIFGPVLHIASFDIKALDQVIENIHAAGYGLTFGFHSRINTHINKITTQVQAGNIYINRNQIGAIVGSQPFGGEGLSGTGPKAGGPCYMPRLSHAQPGSATQNFSQTMTSAQFQALFHKSNLDPHHLIETREMDGPTGEENLWRLYAKRIVLCLGPGTDVVQSQMEAAKSLGCTPIGVTGQIDPKWLIIPKDLDAVIYWGADPAPYQAALADRAGAIIPLILAQNPRPYLQFERHICIDTTASGGNVELLRGQNRRVIS